MGLAGLFESAEAAGMTPKQFQAYLKKIADSKDTARQRLVERDLAREQARLTREYKAQMAKVAEGVRENLGQQQVYQALNNVAQTRLDRAEVEAIAEREGFKVTDLPKQTKGRAIYTTRQTEPAVSVEAHAELNGYEDGTQMLLDMVTAKDFDEAVAEIAERVMDEKFGLLNSQIDRIVAARKALHESGYADVLHMELDALNRASKQRKISRNAVKSAAKKLIQKTSIGKLSPSRFLANERRWGKRAGVLIRKGDLQGAAKAKLNQLLNHQMASEAFKAKTKAEKQFRQLKKMSRFKKKGEKLPVEYQQAIVQLLQAIQMRPKLGKAKRKALTDLAKKVGGPKIPDQILLEDQRPYWRDMTLEDFTVFYQTVRDIRHQGLTLNKFRREREAQQIDQVVEVLIAQLNTNLPNKSTKSENETWEKTKNGMKSAGLLLYNADTVLAEIDGMADLGPAYENIKGRYDRAMSEGYTDNRIGFIRREQLEARNILKLFEAYSLEERKEFHTLRKIEGVGRKLNKSEVLSVMLNSGNAQNIEAMIESGQFTQSELEAIWNNGATKKDWEVVQAVWDYLDSFWPEIKKAEEARRNYSPEKVEAQEVRTKHGNFKGGYYPLRYDTKDSLTPKSEDLETMFSQALSGGFITHHTKRGHTEARTDSRKNKVLLDLYVLNSHIHRVIYDLEMGDALSDIWKLLSNKKLKDAFVEAGQKPRYEYLELWLRDVTTEQVHRDNVVEKSLRWIRTGLTVSALAWNIGVSVIQVLGLIQTSVRL